MTLLIATVTEEAGYLTHDTFMAGVSSEEELPAHRGATTDIEAAMAAAGATCDGRPPAPPNGFTCKLGLFPQHRLVVGGCGGWAAMQSWCSYLGTRLVSDIDEINEWAPRVLPVCRKADPIIDRLFVVHIGYSPRQRRVCGFAYDSAADFRPSPIGSGHTVHPVVPVSDYLRERWNAAAFGCGTEYFHLELAKEMHGAYRRGELHSLTGIGGEIHTARITSDALEVRVAHRFPEYEAQLAEVRRQRLVELQGAG